MAVTTEPVTDLGPNRSLGPITRRRQLRALAAYLSVATVGVALVLVSDAAPLRAFGAGLWFPGSGFLALGGWWIALGLLVVILFGLSLIAWFGAGGTLFPASRDH